MFWFRFPKNATALTHLQIDFFIVLFITSLSITIVFLSKCISHVENCGKWFFETAQNCTQLTKLRILSYLLKINSVENFITSNICAVILKEEIAHLKEKFSWLYSTSQMCLCSFSLNVELCKFHNNRYMITSTQITFAFTAVRLFK